LIHKEHPWRPLVPVVLALAIVAAPLPALAGEPEVSARPASIAASAQKAAVAQAKADARMARAQSNTGTKTDLGSPSFFKSPAGIITLIAVGAGLGFALYSTSHDRVQSPNVDYGNGGR
jgi:hypothetical protein